METVLEFEDKQIKEPQYASIESLYKRWASVLFNYANYLLNDQEASATVVNDLFLNLWSSYREIDNIKAYLFKSVKNASLNYLSIKAKKQVSYMEHNDLAILSDEYQTVDGIIEESDKLLHIKKLISMLPEKRQLVFRMHRMEGFSYAEISDLLQISPRTVEDHLSKSMKFLHENSKHIFNPPLTKA